MPKFSIVIPTFNSRNHIVETVRAALAQSWDDLEVVIDDNNSIDGTLNIVQEWFGRDPRIKIKKNEINLNIPLGWNRAISHATGKYFLLLHSDNLLHRDYASTVIPLMEAFQSVAAYSDASYFHETTPSDIFSNPVHRNEYSLLCKGPRAVAYTFRSQRMIPTSVTTVKLSAFSKRLPYIPKYAWDPDMELLSWLALKHGVLHVHSELGAIRTHRGQARAWKDSDFSKQYQELLLLQHRRGQTERIHYYSEICSSSKDLTTRLADLGAPPSYVLRYLLRWLGAECDRMAHASFQFGRQLSKIMTVPFVWMRSKFTAIETQGLLSTTKQQV